MEIKDIDFKNFEIPFEKVLSRLGYLRGKTELNAKLINDIKEEIRFADKLINPKFVLADSFIQSSEPDETYLEPGLKIKSKDIHGLLHGCTRAFGFAVTIGPALEKKRDSCINEKNTLKALLLDSIGSVSAEEIAETLNKGLKDEAAKENLVLTRRFSPGYGDWDIKSQADFLKWLGAEKIGIRLTNQMQMLPEKSVSAIIGIKPYEQK